MGTAKRERQKANRQQRLEELARQAQKQKRKKGFARWGAAAVAGVLAILLLVVLTGKDNKKSSSASGTTTSVETTVAGPDTPCPAADGSSPKTQTFAKAPPLCIDPAKTYTAVIETTKGSYTVALDAKNAPKTVNNFVVLARYHYFDDTNCHRVIQGFMAQCGDPSGTGTSGATADNPVGKYPGYKFADENLPSASSYPKGTLAMANSGPNTNGSQFFTMLADYPLGPNYSVFGKVTDGVDTTLKAIEAVGVPADKDGTPPSEPVTIKKVTITEA